VRNTEVKTLVLRLYLNTPKYNLMFCPKITANGVEVNYSPLDEIVVEFPLNKTIGPVDKVIDLKVADPTGPRGWLRRERAHNYYVRVRQPPEFEKVVMAQGINVIDSDGQEVRSNPPFNKTSDEVNYHYILKEHESSVTLQIMCTDEATGVSYDGERMQKGASKTIDMVGSIKKVLAQCIYEDTAWTDAIVRRTYMVTLSRTVGLEKLKMNLVVMPEQGYCTRNNASDANQGFVCRADVEMAQFVAVHGDSALDVTLVKNDDGEKSRKFIMRTGLPITMPMSHKRQAWTLHVEAGDAHRDYQVTVIWPAHCSTMKCPVGMTVKPGLHELELAKQHMCQGEVCDKRDEARCCVDVAKCSTFNFECPGRQSLRHDAERAGCRGPICDAGDAVHCCAGQARCSSFGFMCPKYKALRSDAENVLCGGQKCTLEDAEMCCMASCDTLKSHGRQACPAQKTLREDASQVGCAGATCGRGDVSTCCELQKVSTSGNKTLLFLSMTVHFLPLARLAARPTLRGIFERLLREAVAKTAGHGLLARDVSLALEPVVAAAAPPHRRLLGGERIGNCGDSIAKVTVALPPGFSPEKAGERLSQSALRDIVTTKLTPLGGRGKCDVSISDIRLKYEVFRSGVVKGVNNDGTYVIRYANGEVERHVPEQDLRGGAGAGAAPDGLHRWVRVYKSGERGLDSKILAIAGVRERLDHYKAVGCGPVPAVTCSSSRKDNESITPRVPHFSPGAEPMRCFYDEVCSSVFLPHGGLGCNAGGHDRNCRFCGFDNYLPCPKAYDCSMSGHWAPEKKEWCCKRFYIACPMSHPTMVTVLRKFEREQSGRWAFGSQAVSRAALASCIAVGLLGVVVAFAAARRPRIGLRSLALAETSTYELAPCSGHAM